MNAAAFFAAFHFENESVCLANLRRDVGLDRLVLVRENIQLHQLLDQNVVLDPELRGQIAHDDRRLDVNDLLRLDFRGWFRCRCDWFRRSFNWRRFRLLQRMRRNQIHHGGRRRSHDGRLGFSCFWRSDWCWRSRANTRDRRQKRSALFDFAVGAFPFRLLFVDQ